MSLPAGPKDPSTALAMLNLGTFFIDWKLLLSLSAGIVKALSVQGFPNASPAIC
jgi:hypothetical protein